MEKELFNTQDDKVRPEDMEVKKVPETSAKPGTEPQTVKLGSDPIIESCPMIFKKILDIQEELPAVLKTHASYQGQKLIYNFRGIDDLYNAVNPLFKKHRVFMPPEVISRESSEKPTQAGGVLLYEKIHVKYKLYAEDGSFIEATTIGIGMDSGDKAGNKAMSAAQKYALIQIFSIPTEEKKDSENDSPDPANEEFLEVMKNLEGCKSIEDLSMLWDTYPQFQKNPMILKVFANHKAKLKGGKK